MFWYCKLLNNTARSKECKYHIFRQYWYTKNVPVFTNTGSFQYLGPEVYFFLSYICSLLNIAIITQVDPIVWYYYQWPIVSFLNLDFMQNFHISAHKIKPVRCFIKLYYFLNLDFMQNCHISAHKIKPVRCFIKLILKLLFQMIW